jgi:glycosyltransferase involved in cell wall biosynthesis
MTLSLCLTTYNRFALTIESFAQVIDDPRIDDIVIFDDCSTDGSHEKIRKHFSENTKVTVLRQQKNVGMSLNKHDAIAAAKNEWCIIFDSDNIIGPDYLDALESVGAFNENTLYLPVAANPNFNYRKFSGLTVTANNITKYMGNEMFRCALNTCNCLVNRDYYTNAFIEDPKIGCADTINHIHNHLKVGGELYFVPTMEYFHLVGPQSGFLENADYNIRKAKEIENKIMRL